MQQDIHALQGRQICTLPACSGVPARSKLFAVVRVTSSSPRPAENEADAYSGNILAFGGWGGALRLLPRTDVKVLLATNRYPPGVRGLTFPNSSCTQLLMLGPQQATWQLQECQPLPGR